MQQLTELKENDPHQLAKADFDDKGTDVPLPVTDSEPLTTVQVFLDDKRDWTILKARLGMTSPEAFRYSLRAAEEKLESSEKAKG